MQYNNKTVKNYDMLYSHKDYKSELDFIDQVSDGLSGKRVLDIGCGTGTHAILMSKSGALFVKGIDISNHMIRKAALKSAELNNVSFSHVSIQDLDDDPYDMIVSLFNVINHIPDVSSLLSFVRAIRCNIKQGGYFIFDSWNGIAAIKDGPKTITREYEDSGSKISLLCEPITKLMESSVTLKTTVSKDDEVYSYSLTHLLWTPKVISDVLAMSGFKLEKICNGFDLNLNATEDDYKITYVCIAE